MSADYISKKLRADVLRADNATCAYCGSPGDCIDHYIPQTRYGPSVLDNLYTCCRSCNSIKGDRPIYEVGLALRFGRFAFQSAAVSPVAPLTHVAAPADNPDYISDDQIIEISAYVRRPNGRYHMTPEKIATLVGGDRNTVLARIKELRATPAPAEYFQPDGTKAAASYPVSGRRVAS